MNRRGCGPDLGLPPRRGGLDVTRTGTLAAVTLATSAENALTIDSSDVSLILTIANPLGTMLALAGVAFCAIAAHRREWSATLLIAWILNVAAALYVPELFVYFDF